MSIETVKQRMADVQATVSSIRSKTERMFGSILQEKLGTSGTASGGGESASAEDPDTATYESTLTPVAVVSNVATVQVDSTAYNYNNAAAAYQQQNAYANTNSAYCAACAANGVYQNQQAAGSGYNASLAQSGLNAEDIQKASPYMQYVNEANQRYGMPVNLILGIMKAESDFNNECVSYAGAKGLMQLMPETAAEVGVTNEFDPRQNILGSVEYVTKLINKYGGDVRLALAAYNTGPGKIARRGVTSSTSAEYLTVPQSIRDYADRVLRYAGYQN